MQYGLTCINRFKTYNAYLIPWVQNWKINDFIRLCSFLYTHTHTHYSFVLQIFHGFFLTKQDCFLHFAYIELQMSTGKDERWLAGYFFEFLLTYTCFKSSLRSEMTFQITFLSSSHTYMQLLCVYLFMKQCLNASLMVRSSFKQAWI